MTIYVNNPLVLSQSLASVITIYIVFLSDKIKDDLLLLLVLQAAQTLWLFPGDKPLDGHTCR